MTTLFLFPCLPGSTSGYSIAVNSDQNYMKPKPTDYKLYIVENRGSKKKIKNSIFVYRNSYLFRLSNLLATGHPSFFAGFYLTFLIATKFKTLTFDTVFFGDINFYPLNKYLKSGNKIFRLHNLYLKIHKEASKRISFWHNLTFYYLCIRAGSFERRVISFCMKNPISSILFSITEEESNYINMLYAYTPKTLKIKIDSIDQESEKEEFNWDRKLIWLGGLSKHKKISIQYFIKNVYTDLHKEIPGLSFELIGKGTNNFTNNDLGIFGMGFINSFSFNSYRNSIFINPDIVGGGVKLKLFTLYDANVKCLSTPLGCEGFDKKDVWQNLSVKEIEDWASLLKNI